jgi:hypothetical protein
MASGTQKIMLLLLFTLSLSVIGHAQKWERVPDFDRTRRMGAIAFSWEGKGYVGFGHDYNARYPFNDLTAFDPATGQWTEVTWLDSGFRTGAFCFLLGNEAYIGGGTRDSAHTALRDFHKYNLRTGKWAHLASLPFTNAFGARAVVCGSRAYVLGGCTTSGFEPLVWAYDASADTWRAGPPLPVKSVYPIAFALGDTIYYGFGNGPCHETFTGLWKLPPDTSTWISVKSFARQGRTLATAIAITPTKAVAGLGFRMQEYLEQGRGRPVINGRVAVDWRPESDFMMPDFWCFDATNGHWKQLKSQKLGRRGAISFIVGNYLYVGMGNAENKITKDVYRLDLSKLR